VVQPVTNVISVRVPSAWEGRLSSAGVREWVESWLREPVALPAAPEAGTYKLNLRLSSQEARDLQRISGRSTSSAIRGIISLNLKARSAVPRWRKFALLIGAVIVSLVIGLNATRVGQEP
jgi:hypothetical protein